MHCLQLPPIALGALAVATACTTFDNVTLSGIAQGTTVDAADEGSAPVDSPLALATFADAARVCSLVQRCPQLNPSLLISDGIPADPFSYSMCMQWMAGQVPPSRVGLPLQRATVRCIAHAEQAGGPDACAVAGSCVGYEAISPADPRCGDGGITSTCLSPTDVLRCDYGSIYHCAQPDFGPNMKCMKGSDGQYECGSGTCGSQGASQCLGDLLDGCATNFGLLSDVNCASAGQHCGTDPSNAVVCLSEPGTSRSCNTAGEITCSASIVEVCVGGAYSEWDCASLGEMCTMAGGGPRCAPAPPHGCSPNDVDVDGCSGSVITVCVDGARVGFDCASIGLSCSMDAGGSGGRCM